MVQMAINFGEKENEVIERLKEHWNLSKPDTVMKIIRDFKLEVKK